MIQKVNAVVSHCVYKRARGRGAGGERKNARGETAGVEAGKEAYAPAGGHGTEEEAGVGTDVRNAGDKVEKETKSARRSRGFSRAREILGEQRGFRFVSKNVTQLSRSGKEEPSGFPAIFRTLDRLHRAR